MIEDMAVMNSRNSFRFIYSYFVNGYRYYRLVFCEYQAMDWKWLQVLADELMYNHPMLGARVRGILRTATSRIFILPGLVYAFLYSLWVILMPPDRGIAYWISISIVIIPWILAIYQSWRTTTQQSSIPLIRFWVLFTSSLGLWVAGDLVRFYLLPLGNQAAWLGSAGAFLTSLGYLACLIAWVIYPLIFLQT
jgi:hypothetical protein